MRLAAATLDRTDRRTLHGLALLPVQPSTIRSVSDDDEALDAWLAALSVDEFEQILSGLANLRSLAGSGRPEHRNRGHMPE